MRIQIGLLICCLAASSTASAAAQNKGNPSQPSQGQKTAAQKAAAPASKAAAPHPWKILWQSPFNKVTLKEDGSFTIRYTPPAPANNPRDLKEEFVDRQLDRSVVSAIFAKAALPEFLNSAGSYDPKPGSADVYRTIYTSADLFDSKGQLIHRVRVSDKAVVKPPGAVQELLSTIGDLRAKSAGPARKPEF